MIQKVLIANRGEIAFRIVKTLKKMGIASVVLFSDVDQHEQYVHFADEAWHLEGNVPKETYLNIPRILEIAKISNADAIHPGYGFLSENHQFAEACTVQGLQFIGPTSQAMKSMGDKILSKEFAEKADVPILKAYPCFDRSLKELAQIAEEIAYPVLIKAAAGGGGKGMRVVHAAQALENAITAAQSEALNYFADGRVFMEKFVESPKHIEVQILADSHGHVLHLGERECSIQRRHQKIIEEAPSSALTDTLRYKITAAAVRVAQSVGYTNAGTVEFLLGQDQQFYFLEMNTRLQVEHPVTEMITGIDIVREQIHIANGHPLSFKQEDVVLKGHAVEARIYAENPAKHFIPDTGKIICLELPNLPNVRIETTMREGSEVSIYYDPMVAKVVAWGIDRIDAIKTLDLALKHVILLGFVHNIDFIQDILNHPDFAQGNFDTFFLEQEIFAQWSCNPEIPDEVLMIAARYVCQSKQVAAQEIGDLPSDQQNPWYQMKKEGIFQ